MIILITGGASCGKSQYGENLLKNYDKKLYIATMKPFGEEEIEKIEKHRHMRYGKGFKTLEIFENIKNISFEEKYDAVMFECISNALSNEMFSGNNPDDILNAVRYISDKCNIAVIITSEVGSDGVKYDDFTSEYIKTIARINSEISKMADVVIEVVFGIPVFLKGELKDEVCN